MWTYTILLLSQFIFLKYLKDIITNIFMQICIIFQKYDQFLSSHVKIRVHNEEFN